MTTRQQVPILAQADYDDGDWGSAIAEPDSTEDGGIQSLLGKTPTAISQLLASEIGSPLFERYLAAARVGDIASLKAAFSPSGTASGDSPPGLGSSDTKSIAVNDPIAEVYPRLMAAAFRANQPETVTYLATLEDSDVVPGYQLLYDTMDPLNIAEMRRLCTWLGVSLADMIESIVLYQLDETAALAISRVMSSDSPLTDGEVYQLYHLSVDKGNYHAQDALTPYFQGATAPIPPWVTIITAAPGAARIEQWGNPADFQGAAAPGTVPSLSDPLTGITLVPPSPREQWASSELPVIPGTDEGGGATGLSGQLQPGVPGVSEARGPQERDIRPVLASAVGADLALREQLAAIADMPVQVGSDGRLSRPESPRSLISERRGPMATSSPRSMSFRSSPQSQEASPPSQGAPAPAQASNFQSSPSLSWPPEVAIKLSPAELWTNGSIEHDQLIQLAEAYRAAWITRTGPETILAQAKRAIESYAQKLAEPLDLEASITINTDELTADSMESIYQWALMIDPGMARLVGPVNVILAVMGDEADECARLGGCRMAICRHLTEDEDSGPDYDWFTGRCDITGHTIVDRRLAMRVPLITGGWHGCYHDEISARVGMHQRFSYRQDRELHDQLMTSLIGQLMDLGMKVDSRIQADSGQPESLAELTSDYAIDGPSQAVAEASLAEASAGEPGQLPGQGQGSTPLGTIGIESSELEPLERLETWRELPASLLAEPDPSAS